MKSKSKHEEDVREFYESPLPKKKVKSNDLEIEKKAILDMSRAKKSVNVAIIELMSALSRTCFSKSKSGNANDIDTLSSSVDSLITVRNNIEETLAPYLTFHDIDEQDLEEWVLQVGK